MSESVEIRWHARAGQGAKTAALLLAQAALRDGKFAQAFPEFGPERRGAPIQAFNRIASHAIRVHSGVRQPDIIIVLDETLLDTVPVTSGLATDGIVFVNSPESPLVIRERLRLAGQRVATVDASRIARDHIGRPIPSAPMLGAFAAVTELISLDTLVTDAITRLEKRFRDRPGMIEGNIEAIRRGYGEVQVEGRFPVSRLERLPSPRDVERTLPAWTDLPAGGIIVTPGSAAAYETGDWRQQRPVWDFDRCVHCLICWVMCPDAAIIVEDGKVVDLDVRHCKGCGICAQVCPPRHQAITMIEEERQRTGAVVSAPVLGRNGR